MLTVIQQDNSSEVVVHCQPETQNQNLFAGMSKEYGEDISPNVLYLIGDQEGSILAGLLGEVAGPDFCSQGVSGYKLRIKTKYYSCSVTIRNFSSIDEAQNWNSRQKHEEIGAVVFKIEDGSYNLSHMREALQNWNVDTSLIACNQLETDSTWTNEMKKFCALEGIELVELNPLQETLAELTEYRETYGISRIIEVLETVTWTNRCLEKTPVVQSNTQKGCSCEAFSACTSSSLMGHCEEVGDKNHQNKHPKVHESKVRLSGSGNASFGDFQSSIDCLNDNDEIQNVEEGDKNPTNSHLFDLKNTSKQKVLLNSQDGNNGLEKVRNNDETLVEENVNDVVHMAEKLVKVRAQLSQMAFCPERQNCAADTMLQFLTILGEDLLEDSSEEDS